MYFFNIVNVKKELYQFLFKEQGIGISYSLKKHVISMNNSG